MSLALVLAGAQSPRAADGPLQVVVLGDSLSAGYLLPQDAAFPVVLEKALRAEGLDVDVSNAASRATPPGAGWSGWTGRSRKARKR